MGYSQEKLAEMMYTTKVTLCRYEKDIHDIPSSVIIELARILETTPDYLLLGEKKIMDTEDECMKIVSRIKDPALKILAVRQLECIAAMEEGR